MIAELADKATAKRLVRLPGVEEKTTLPKPTIYALMRQGKFPRPVSLCASGKRVAWIESEIDSWIDARAAAR